MARAFVLGHGGRDPRDGVTFVPTGRTLSFFSNFDENTFQAVGLAAITLGTIQPAETVTAGNPVTNYELEALLDSEYASTLAATSSQTDATPYWVGEGVLPSPVRLCTTPSACEGTKPLHARECQGLFALIDEADILTVACRGLVDGPTRGTVSLGGDGGAFLLEVHKRAKELVALAATDPAGARSWWESLPDGTRIELRAQSKDLDALIEQWDQLGAFKTPEAVLDARRYLEAYGEETFYEWMSGLELAQRGVIHGDPTLGGIYDRIKHHRERLEYESNRQELLGDPGATELGLDPAELQRIDEQAQAIVVAVRRFAGSEHDDIDGVRLPYGTLMDEVSELQRRAPEHLAGVVASVYGAGADLGMKLAFHDEQRDAESLVALNAAADLLGQWSASLISA